MIGDAVIKSQDSRNLVMTLSVVWQRHRYMSGSRVVRPSRFLSLASILIILSITSVYNTARGPGEYAEQIWNMLFILRPPNARPGRISLRVGHLPWVITRSPRLLYARRIFYYCSAMSSSSSSVAGRFPFDFVLTRLTHEYA